MIYSDSNSSTFFSKQRSVLVKRRKDSTDKIKPIANLKNQNNLSLIKNPPKIRSNVLDVFGKVTDDNSFTRFHKNDKIFTISAKEIDISLNNCASTYYTEDKSALFVNRRELDLSWSDLRYVQVPSEAFLKIEVVESRILTGLA